MSLLFDHNLSHRLVDKLEDEFPSADHVRHRGLERADDAEVWSAAQAHGFAIVTKDNDFNEMLVHRGSPPKVVWIRLGNCSTDAIERALRNNIQEIRRLLSDPEAELLEIGD